MNPSCLPVSENFERYKRGRGELRLSVLTLSSAQLAGSVLEIAKLSTAPVRLTIRSDPFAVSPAPAPCPGTGLWKTFEKSNTVESEYGFKKGNRR